MELLLALLALVVALNSLVIGLVLWTQGRRTGPEIERTLQAMREEE